MKTRDIMRQGATATLHHNVYMILRERLRGGVFPMGEPLPSEPALVEEFGVSRVTIRRALEQLVADGWISKRRGVGTFPTKKVGAGELPFSGTNYPAFLAESSKPYRLSLLAFEFIKSPAFLAHRGLSFGRRVLKVTRLSSLRTEPVHLLTSYIHGDFAHLVSEAQCTRRTMVEILEAGGMRILHTDVFIAAASADLDVARRLDVAGGSPLIHIQRISVGEDGEPLEFSESYSRPDRFRYHLSLDRARNAENLKKLQF